MSKIISLNVTKNHSKFSQILDAIIFLQQEAERLGYHDVAKSLQDISMKSRP